MGSLFKRTPPKADLTKSDYREAVKTRTAAARDAQLGLLRDLEKQTHGQGPSLATAQLQAVQNKNLSQLLAMSAAGRRAPINTLNVGGAAGREAATAGAQARAAEISALQSLRGQTAIGQQKQDLAQVMEPGKLLAQAEMDRYKADQARQQAVRDAQSRLRGAAFKAIGQVAGGMTGGGGLTSFDVGGPAQTPGPQNTGFAGSRFASPDMFAEGGEVPGHIPGNENSYEYDVQHAMLSPEEIVLPRSVTKSEDAPEKAKSFVEAIMERKYAKKPSYEDVLKAKSSKRKS